MPIKSQKGWRNLNVEQKKKKERKNLGEHLK